MAIVTFDQDLFSLFRYYIIPMIFEMNIIQPDNICHGLHIYTRINSVPKEHADWTTEVFLNELYNVISKCQPYRPNI
jgi:hypothetical protein